MILNDRNRVFILILAALLVFFCAENAAAKGGKDKSSKNSGFDNDNNTDNSLGASDFASGSLSEEIRNLTETGVLSSMLAALELIRSRELGNTEFGRLMNAFNVMFIRLV